MLRLTLAANLFFLWALNFTAVCARICGNETGSITGITVWSQEDADMKLDGCTTLVAVLIIGHNFTGDFVLSGVQNLTRGLRTSVGTWWDDPDETEEGVPRLKSVTAPDLVEIGYNGLKLDNAIVLESISFEKLQKAYSVQVIFQAVRGTINFPALESIESKLVLSSNYTSMKFDRLETVESITIGTETRPWQSGSWIGSNPPLEVDFPSLLKCQKLSISGNLSRVSLPKLEDVTRGSSQLYFYSNGLSVTTKGSPLSLSLPSLWNISNIDLVGTFANFSFPALKQVDKFTLASDLPMYADLSPLERADDIRLSGNLTGYNITSLKGIASDLTIISKLSINCGSARKTWLRLHPEDADKEYLSGFYCSEKPKKPFPKLYVGIGLGCGLPIFLLIGIAYWRGRRYRKPSKSATKDELPDYETEMERRRTGGGETLPEYVPSGDRRSTDGASTVSALSNMARPTETPRERPPAYEASHTREAANVAHRGIS